MKRGFAHISVCPQDVQDLIPNETHHIPTLKRLLVDTSHQSSLDSQKPAILNSVHFSTPAERQSIIARLNSLETEIPFSTQQNAEYLLWISDLCYQETSADLIMSALNLAVLLCKHPLASPEPFIDSLLSSDHFRLLLESKKDLMPLVLKSLTSILACKSSSTDSTLKLAHRALFGRSTPSSRAQALLALSKIDNYASMVLLQDLLFQYLGDSDFRVRRVALRALREWMLKRSFLQKLKASAAVTPAPSSAMDVDGARELDFEEFYTKSVEALTDDADTVQMEALRNIWMLANLHPERFVDDAFRKLCNMVSDASVSVRSEACGLLGTLPGVTPKLLLQSLSKNMLKVGVTSVDGKATWKEDPFDPGAGQNANVDVVSKFTTTSKLIDSGANGALIHGLEDEFKEVRDAALASMCELAHKSKMFALKSTEFFVDMFNDEIDTVRVHALQSVSKIGQLIFLSEDQLLVVLAMLDDATITVRQSTRKLLTAIRLMNAHSLLTAVNVLQSTLTKYFTERDSILPTFAAIGKNHPHFVELLFEDLFKIDTRFVMREPRLDTLSYVSVAILLLNAAKENHNLLEWLPPFIHRHYLYLKRHYPLLIPDIPTYEVDHSLLYSPSVSSHSKKTTSIQKAQSITDRILSGTAAFQTFSVSNPSSTSTPGFSYSDPIQRYQTSHNLFSSASQISEDNSTSAMTLESIFDKLSTSLASLGQVSTLDSEELLNLASIVGSIRYELSNLKFHEENKEFYISYCELLESCSSPQLRSDVTLQAKCATKTLFLRTMFIGLPRSVFNILDSLYRLWDDFFASSEPLITVEFVSSIWEVLKQPLRITHRLKKVRLTIFQPNSEQASVREVAPAIPLPIHVVAQLTCDDLSDLFIVVTCEEIQFKISTALTSSNFTRRGPLSYSVLATASIPPQKWENNKVVHLSLTVCRIGAHQWSIPLSAPVSLAIRSKFK